MNAGGRRRRGEGRHITRGGHGETQRRNRGDRQRHVKNQKRKLGRRQRHGQTQQPNRNHGTVRSQNKSGRPITARQKAGIISVDAKTQERRRPATTRQKAKNKCRGRAATRRKQEINRGGRRQHGEKGETGKDTGRTNK